MEEERRGRTITLEALRQLPQKDYVLVDVRDEASFRYDTMPHARHMPDVLERAVRGTLPEEMRERKTVLFCQRGGESLRMADALAHQGLDAVSLEGGFVGFLEAGLSGPDMAREVEDALRRNRRWHETLFSPFARAVRDFKLVNAGDRIAVCISGGKDSMLMAKLFQELERQHRVPFELVYLVMDPGYNSLNRRMIEENARKLGIPITVFESPIFETVDRLSRQPCFACARMRRGYLYKKAQELGCGKIALGHHYDDVIETILMSMLWSGQYQTMMPKLHASHWKGMELIRPMYYIREDDIRAWRDSMGLHFIQCACRLTEEGASTGEDGMPVSKRMETKLLIRRLRETNPRVEANLFHTMQEMNVDTLISYTKGGIRHHFLDSYEESAPEA